jgi:hypothetical protein
MCVDYPVPNMSPAGYSKRVIVPATAWIFALKMVTKPINNCAE